MAKKKPLYTEIIKEEAGHYVIRFPNSRKYDIIKSKKGTWYFACFMYTSTARHPIFKSAVEDAKKHHDAVQKNGGPWWNIF